MKVSGSVLSIIVILAGVAVLQFFQGRKINVGLMRLFIQGFEKKLKIKDQLYTLIGEYSGFRVNYDLSDKYINNVEMSLTLLPRQSLFYLPFSFMFKRGDRLFIVLRPKFKVRNDAHIIQNFYYLFGPDIQEKGDLEKGKVSFEKKEGFYSLTNDKYTLDKLKKLAESSLDVRRLRHICVVKRTNVLFCLIRPDPSKTPDEVKKLVENFPKIFKEEKRETEILEELKS